MSDKVYRIKPLVWEKYKNDWYQSHSPIFDLFQVWKNYTGLWSFNKDNVHYDSLEAAQLAAEQWHRERMAAGLVEVEV